MYAGSGGLQSTVGDLVTWQMALTSGKVLSLSVLAQMWTPPHLPDSALTDYGMGWVVGKVNGQPVIWHNGAIPGATGFVGYFPDAHLTVVILSNLFLLGGPREKHTFFSLGQGLAALYVPALSPPGDTDSGGRKSADERGHAFPPLPVLPAGAFAAAD